MTVEQIYFLSFALINLVFAIAGTRVKEPSVDSKSIPYFVISFFAYFISCLVYVFELNPFLEILSALAASVFVWGMVIFYAKKSLVKLPWPMTATLFLIQCVLQTIAILQFNLTIYLHISGVMLPIAFLTISYMLLKLKSDRNSSDSVLSYIYIAMSFIVIGRSILLETSPELFAASSLYSQIIWPAFCTTIGVFTLQSYTEEAQVRLEKESNTDLLTGLANRRMFEVSLSNCLLSLSRSNHYGALVYFDLDGFKPINDQYGHYVGDQVLMELGRRLKSSSRSEEVIARIGGDEFALLLTPAQTQSEMKVQAKKLAVRMQKVIRTPIQCDEFTIQVSSSIGVHIIAPGSQSAEVALTEADNAMYQSKSMKNGEITFSDSLIEPAYSIAKIGVRDIDFEHQEIDEFLQSLLSGKQPTESDFKQIIEQVKAHFNSEERLSKELGLNMSKQHIRDHRKIVGGLTKAYESENGNLTKEHVLLIGKVVSVHSFEFDQMLNRSKGID